MLTFVRIGTLIKADWSQMAGNERRILAENMKGQSYTHVAPLSDLTLEMLAETRALNPNRALLFPSQHRDNKFINNHA